VHPVIGIAPDVDAAGSASIEPDCRRAVERAGGEIRVLAPQTHLCDGCDALLLCGGAFDIPPAWYGEVPQARVDPPREARGQHERALLAAAEARGTPVLGICGGAQLMAVHRGGSLVQDLATQWPGALDHERGGESRRTVHAVRLAADSRLATLLGAHELAVNSTHHQSVRRPGAGVLAVGWAPDAVIEAIEDPSRPFWIGVQWHPERLAEAHAARLLRALVEAAAGAAR
jgi:putative glutamine amidotransferase